MAVMDEILLQKAVAKAFHMAGALIIASALTALPAC